MPPNRKVKESQKAFIFLWEINIYLNQQDKQTSSIFVHFFVFYLLNTRRTQPRYIVRHPNKNNEKTKPMFHSFVW